MNKKIVAAVCAVILIVSVLTACAKKPTITGDNGMEYEVVTDDEGSSVVNDNGDIAVMVTDDNGKYVKDENGEPQTNYIKFPDNIVNGMTYETKNFKFTMPLEGWTVTSRGLFIKNNTEEKVFLSVKDLGELKEGETLDTVVSNVILQNDKIMNEIKKNYPDSTVNVEKVKITDSQTDAQTVEFVIKDTSGNMVYYSHGTFFIRNKQILKVEYIVNDGKYYDPSINMLDIINENLTIK